ncbi:hypothetical protein, partial [Thermoflexus hugenholtzii]
DRRWLQARFREGVVIVVLGVDQDEVAPVLGLKRLRDPKEGVIPMGSLEYVMAYEVMEGDPWDIAIVRETGRFWESREFWAPAGMARPLYHGGGKSIGRLDSEGELRLLFHRLRMAIQGVYEIRAQYQEALRTFEGR